MKDLIMTMPAGRYYIGDLCYVMHPEWDEFCKITIKEMQCLDGEFELADGRRFATYGTYYGNGTYYSSFGTEHSVDAGLIGCILLSDIRDEEGLSRAEELGAVVDFHHPFETGCEDGVIFFGNMVIDTKNSEDEDENEIYDYDEEDE